MRHLARAAVAVAALATPALAQKVGQTIDVGGWKLESSVNKDGSTGCSATFVYDDKSVIAFAVDNDDTHMFIVVEPTAKMVEGQQTQLTYRIDKGKNIVGMGIAANPVTLAVPIPSGDVDAIYRAFKVGNSLFIKLGKEEFEEPLDGSSDAIDALGKCQSNLPARKK